MANKILRKVRKHQSLILKELIDSTRARIIYDFLNFAPVWRTKIAIPCKYQRPKENKILLNMDGAVNNISFGFSGLLRKRSGGPMLFYSGSERSESVLEQELRGVELGLVAARGLEILNIAIASDSQLAVNIVGGMTKPP